MKRTVLQGLPPVHKALLALPLRYGSILNCAQRHTCAAVIALVCPITPEHDVVGIMQCRFWLFTHTTDLCAVLCRVNLGKSSSKIVLRVYDCIQANEANSLRTARSG